VCACRKASAARWASGPREIATGNDARAVEKKITWADGKGFGPESAGSSFFFLFSLFF
jgi:hypothetical protein